MSHSVGRIWGAIGCYPLQGLLRGCRQNFGGRTGLQEFHRLGQIAGNMSQAILVARVCGEELGAEAFKPADFILIGYYCRLPQPPVYR